MTDKPKILNARQEAFCQSYARSANATQAAKDAGYSEKTAHAQGWALLKHPEIGPRIETIHNERFQKLHMSADDALAEVARAARFSFDGILKVVDGVPYIDLEKATPDHLAVLTEASMSETGVLKVKGPNKIAALGLIMRHHGLLKDKLELSVDSDFAAKMAAAMQRARPAEGDGNDG